ncbi:hypothetical protein ACE01N_06010 [Saccharicrinis sp. FJH2]|uniref:hypothetical protein n=1 Tax=Saccharicrinis sp. FJH65 TaxID=3344659 RepID=UPI0035F42ADD
MKKTTYFFRNDDVRGSLDESLINLTNVFIKHGIPICHAVEPANVSDEVVTWLLEQKKQNPGIIEIVQHGYDHKLNFEGIVYGKLRKGEFGGERTFEDQLKDIEAGRKIMDDKFGDRWFKAFTFPFGARNKASIKAIDNLNYQVVNGGVSNKFKNKAFYIIGHLLRKEIIAGHKVSYHLKKKPGTRLFQIDIALSVIKKYINDKTDCIFYSFEELKSKTIALQGIDTRGILFHHRYHKSKETIDLIDEYLTWLKTDSNNIFMSQEEIFQKYAG